MNNTWNKFSEGLPAENARFVFFSWGPDSLATVADKDRFESWAVARGSMSWEEAYWKYIEFPACPTKPKQSDLDANVFLDWSEKTDGAARTLQNAFFYGLDLERFEIKELLKGTDVETDPAFKRLRKRLGMRE
jgi:hypothetical protein